MQGLFVLGVKNLKKADSNKILLFKLKHPALAGCFSGGQERIRTSEGISQLISFNSIVSNRHGLYLYHFHQ